MTLSLHPGYEAARLPRLRRPDLAEEAIELSGEIARLGRELFGGAQHFPRGRTGVVGGALHARYVGVDLLGAARGLLDAAGDLLGRRALFLDRGPNGGADLVDLADDVGDVADRGHGLVARGLDRRNLPEISVLALAVWPASDFTS